MQLMQAKFLQKYFMSHTQRISSFNKLYELISRLPYLLSFTFCTINFQHLS